MYKTIRAELYKQYHSRLPKYCFLITLVIVIIVVYNLWGKLLYALHLFQEIPTASGGYSVHFLSEYSSVFSFFIPFLVVEIFGVDYSRGIVGNLLGHNITRPTIFVSKYIVFALSVLIMQFFASILYTVLSTIINGWGTRFSVLQIGNLITLTFCYSLMFISTATVTILSSIVVKSEVVVVVIFFLRSLIESIVASIINVAAADNRYIHFLSNLFETNYSTSLFSLPIDKKIVPYFLISVTLNVLCCILVGKTICNRKDIL